ncbi:unnamed protein product [Anisakis simplex]|uniref:Uncharacterized protein n=1 Tax=Anisakis simplex TaxID=6269 RepID=A0A0M3J934_ANISI|nr:unnamed protein product [Anisakis simplex]
MIDLPVFTTCDCFDRHVQTDHFKDGSIIPPSANAGFKGTTRYASIRAHQKKELGRSDDLESWLYVNVEFSTGRLPWKSGKGKANHSSKVCSQ